MGGVRYVLSHSIATRSMSKNAIHVVGLSASPCLTPRSALNGCGSSSSINVGGIDFLSFFVHAGVFPFAVNIDEEVGYVRWYSQSHPC